MHSWRNFNSHAHVERDPLKVATSQLMKRISTHTLTWSVTSSSVGGSSVSVISTHTLTWSVTFLADVQLRTIAISTHTLTWSVT